MEDDIPWLDSSELVEADAELAQSTGNPASLAPFELSFPFDAAPLSVPKRSRAAVAMLAVLGASVAALVFSTGSARVRVPTAPVASQPHAAALRPPTPMVAPAPIVQPPVVAVPRVAAPTPTLTPTRPKAAAAVRVVPTGRDGEVRAAFASLNAGKTREALKLARAIVNVAPERADAWLVLGSAYDALHDRENAQAAFHACAARAHGPALASCKQLARD